jgi:hypothetical protein
MAILPNVRSIQVQGEISQAFAAVARAEMLRRDAAKEWRATGAGIAGAQEAALLSLASAAERDQWSVDEVCEGVKQALSRRNDIRASSAAVFASQIRCVCRPAVRAHVPRLAKMIAEIWEVEGKAPLRQGRPCRRAFARRYHMLVAATRAIKDGREFGGREALIRWAAERHPEHDAGRVMKRLTAIRDALNGLAERWGNAELTACVVSLGRITVEDLSPVPGRRGH